MSIPFFNMLLVLGTCFIVIAQHFCLCGTNVYFLELFDNVDTAGFLALESTGASPGVPDFVIFWNNHFLYPVGSQRTSFCTWAQHLHKKTKQTHHPPEHPNFLVQFILFLLSGKYTKSC